jgi:hypothetical protein
MEPRRVVHQPDDRTGGMVSYRGLTDLSRLPLLPFERELVATLGCTEAEYRAFTIEAMKRSRVRPAEYDGVPDIINGPETWIPIVISLVLGVVTSAISYLLMPKPKPPQADRRQQQTLDSISGSSRFSPTTGFDARAELANYGDPIPIVFGRYTGTSGGILVSPKLVWSRMFSYGTQQGVKMLFVVGEQGYSFGGTYDGILPPDLEGIFLGNGALDIIYQNTFAFYWKRNTTSSGFSRIRSANLLYGTRGTGATGDPESQDDVFSCPTRVSEVDTGFSSAHSLSNSSEFGCYAPIANGTGYRVNWAIVSATRDREGLVIDPGNTQLLQRVKIAGNGDETYTAIQIRALGMPGTGRNYSRRMGITAHNGTTVPDTKGGEERTVSINDTIQFVISKQQLAASYYAAGNVKIEDINSALNEERIAADGALQVGELFMIARTVWQVTSRSLPLWRPEDNRDQIISMKCIDIVGRNIIGIVSHAALVRDYLTDFENSTYFIGPSYYPLLRVNFATVRNTRACDVTEVGLRSKVFQSANGICNFQSLPSPQELYVAELNEVTLQNGTTTLYIRRASAFTVFVRPAGVDANGRAFAWTDLDIRFVVVGNEPVDQFNFIRFNHPATKQFEYRFIPKNGADMRNSSDTAEFWQLNANAGSSQLRQNLDTVYGRFIVTAPATRVFKTQLQQNIEFLNQPTTGGAGSILPTYPSVVSPIKNYPEEEANRPFVTSVTYQGVEVVPSTVTDGKMASFAWEIFGSAVTSLVPDGGTTTALAVEVVGTRTVTIRYTARKNLRIGHYSGQTFTWTIEQFEVISATGSWTQGEVFRAARNTSASNPFRIAPGGTITSSGVVLAVSGIRTLTEVQGREQALYEEFFGPARSVAVGTVATYALTYTEGPKIINMVLSSTSYSNPLHWSGANLLWGAPTITVLTTSALGVWVVGDVFDVFEVVSNGNPFRTPGSTVGVQYQVTALAVTTLPPGLINSARAFEGSSQFADISFYGNLLEKSNSSAPEHAISYVNEIVANELVPTYEYMTIAGLALKASRNFTALDQLHFWLRSGCPVKRFHPDDGNTIGPSNLFCDLVFHLLTDGIAGAGRVLNMTPDNPTLISTESMVTTARFLKANQLFFDGTIAAPINLRQYISTTAPSFLCNFVISNGKFGLLPALPTTAAGAISTAAVTIKGLFTAGNILEDSYELEYLQAEERKDFQAIIRYRKMTLNQLPEEQTLSVRWADSQEYVPTESFDITGFCTSANHAKLVAKFFLSIRRRVTHSIRFKTVPFGINLAPSDFIKVVTESSPYSSARNGTIGADGTITSVSAIANGTYSIFYYTVGAEDVDVGTMTVSGGKATQSSLFNSVFTIKEVTRSENIYMIEQLTLEEDGTVQIAASEFPCDANLASIMAKDVLTDSLFVFET